MSKSRLHIPGLASAHSHVFQRAIRAQTQQLASGQAGASQDFWSWRGLMYQFAEKLDPESLRAIATFAYAEMALAGYTAVGEFHYLHHQRDGIPYDERTALADAVIQAAKRVGIRISLLRVIYQRAGHGNDLEPGQQRFCDEDLSKAFADIDTLDARYADDPCVTVGIAPHSIRAVSREAIIECAQFAQARDMAFHMHVSEQVRELNECREEYGTTPIKMLADAGVLGRRFVGVHATHLAKGEATLLGDSGAIACLCRTTERDLGDGLPNVSELRHAGVKLCTGIDSHALCDPFEEVRAIELDERSRSQSRQVAVGGADFQAVASENGYEAVAMRGLHQQDEIVLNLEDPALFPLVDGDTDESAMEAVLWSASPRCVSEVSVAGRKIVESGRLGEMDKIRVDAMAAMAKLRA